MINKEYVFYHSPIHRTRVLLSIDSTLGNKKYIIHVYEAKVPLYVSHLVKTVVMDIVKYHCKLGYLVSGYLKKKLVCCQSWSHALD